MEMLTVVLAIYVFSLVALFAVAASEARHYKSLYQSEKDLNQRLIAHLSRKFERPAANVVPFVRGRK